MGARSYHRLVTPIALLLSLAGAPARAQSPCTNPLIAENQAAASLMLEPRERDLLRLFYRDRGADCAWSDDQIAALQTALSHAGDQGLDAARYNIDALKTQAVAARDLFSTAMALRYAHDMAMGQIDLATLSNDVDVPRPAIDLVGQLAQALGERRLGPWLAGLAPADPQYARLLNALASYRDKIGRAEWKAIPGGPTLKIGRPDPRIPLLKERLLAEGDLKDPNPVLDFDAATKKAVASFQQRHGISPDRRVGRATLAALNVSDHDRLEQILANLERWRYFGHVLPPTADRGQRRSGNRELVPG